MRCRCSDISRCQRELNALNGSISSNINEANEVNPDITQALQLAASNIEEAINTSTISVLGTSLKNTNNEGKRLSRELCDECTSEIDRLSTLLDDMKREDKDYHKAKSESS